MTEKKQATELDFTKDEYWGRGGRYVVDPATGKRMPAPPIEETPGADLAPGSAPVPAQVVQHQVTGVADAQTADATPAKLKERNRA